MCNKVSRGNHEHLDSEYNFRFHTQKEKDDTNVGQMAL